MPQRSKKVNRSRLVWAGLAMVVLGCAVPAVVRAAAGTEQPVTLAVDGGYAIGDAAGDRPVTWVDMNGDEARQHPFLIAVSIDGRVVGFVRSDDLFAAGPPPDQRPWNSGPALVIVDEQGRRLGEFVDGRPVLDPNG
jgi:hypothetical protein